MAVAAAGQNRCRDPVHSGRTTDALVYAAAWLPYFGASLVALLATGTVPVATAVRMSAVNTLPEALLGLGVLALPRRVPWPERRRSAFAARHLTQAAGFVLAVVASKTALISADRFLTSGGAFSVVWPDRRLLPWQAFIALLIYAALAGLAYARDNAARVAAQAERAARAEALRTQAELHALRAQLNPHFLFNTLHSVLALIAREPATAQRALEQLGDLLRRSLRVEREHLEQVGLREEWELVTAYLELEKMRLGDRLRVGMHAEPGALGSLVPPFCLQPIVENAVQHAVAPRAGGGSITVTARRDGADLLLRVTDDGPGLAAERPNGLGLRLVRERLGALYGPRSTFTTASTAQGGTDVTLRLPASGPGDEE